MGFGNGITAAPRRIDLVRADRVAILAETFALTSRSEGVTQDTDPATRAAVKAWLAPRSRPLLVVPVGTPEPLPTGTALEARARALVIGQRGVLGDARDLYVEVVSRTLAPHREEGGREPDPPRFTTESASLWSAGTCVTSFQHIGSTERAETLLRGYADAFDGWDGDWRSQDADGYAVIALRDPEITLRDAPASEPLRLHPSLLVWIVGSRDEPESLHPFPFRQSADRRLDDSPQRFNEQRWSYLARQTGVYEYHYGTGYLVPRIYTDRLREGLRFSRATKGVAFIAECGPVWGIEGPKLYETARMLWDVEDTDARLDFCTTMFGSAALDMRSVFQRLEDAWRGGARSDDREQRVGPESGGHPFGLTVFHQQRDILQFDYVDDPMQGGNYNRPRPGSVIDDAIATLDRLLAAAQSAYDDALAGRLSFYRDALGFTQLLAWLSRPVRKVRNLMFDQAVRLPATQPDFEPLYGGDRLKPTPDRTQPRAFPRNTTYEGVWEPFDGALRAVPTSYLNVEGFRATVRGPVLQYLYGNDVAVGGEVLRGPSRPYLRARADRSTLSVSGVDIGRISAEPVREDGVWQAFSLPEVAQYVGYVNRRAATPLLRTPPVETNDGFSWFFVSMKNTLLIASECLEDHGRMLGEAPTTGVIFNPRSYQSNA